MVGCRSKLTVILALQTCVEACVRMMSFCWLLTSHQDHDLTLWCLASKPGGLHGSRLCCRTLQQSHGARLCCRNCNSRTQMQRCCLVQVCVRRNPRIALVRSFSVHTGVFLRHAVQVSKGCYEPGGQSLVPMLRSWGLPGALKGVLEVFSGLSSSQVGVVGCLHVQTSC
jgi:hypothetical protein